MVVGDRVEVERPVTPSGRETRTEWVLGSVEGFRAGDAGEGFSRVTVRTDDGGLYSGCHPRHVRPVGRS